MRRRVLILAHVSDAGATRVANELARMSGPAAVQVVSPEALALGRWTHRVNSQGRASTEIALPNGKMISDGEIGAVLNRIQYVPVPRFDRGALKDRDYAAAEMLALIMSWLAGLGDRVVHSLSRHPWLTPWLSSQHWVSVAARHGIPVSRRTFQSRRFPGGVVAQNAVDRQSNDFARHPNPAAHGEQVNVHPVSGTVLVAGQEALGSLSNRYGEKCVAAAHELGLSILEFQFVKEKSQPMAARVDPLPLLTEPGTAGLIASLLQSIRQRAHDSDLRPVG